MPEKAKTKKVKHNNNSKSAITASPKKAKTTAKAKKEWVITMN